MRLRPGRDLAAGARFSSAPPRQPTAQRARLFLPPALTDRDTMSHATKPLSQVHTTDATGEFEFQQRTRVVYGAGRLSELGARAAELGGSRILLVTDAGLAEAGHESRAVESLRAAGLEVHAFDAVHANPTTEDVDAALQVAQAHRVDLIVGLGGGSSMDCAKGVNFLFTNGGRMQDYWGVGKATRPMLPMIAVPTTAGTGSEAQSFAVIAQPDTHMKMACGDKKAACRIAILDPEVTLTMPTSVAAATGIDAISHALETGVTLPRNTISQLFSREAWRRLSTAFRRVLKSPGDLGARGDMLLGAHFAGTAIENSMLGIAHSMANPLSAHFNTIHGHAVGLLLPHVIEFNSAEVGPLYAQLARDAGLEEETPSALSEFVTELLTAAGLPTRLQEVADDPDLIPTLATEAAQQWTARFNPRPATPDDFEALYRAAW